MSGTCESDGEDGAPWLLRVQNPWASAPGPYNLSTRWRMNEDACGVASFDCDVTESAGKIIIHN